jgi:anti-sigma regulatory factor (Ser/Thr protein kinase)
MDLTTGTSLPAVHTRLEFEIPGGRRAPTVARQMVQRLGADLDEQRLNEVRLLVTELVTNSVRHAGAGRRSTVTVSVELTDTTLRVTVSNPGAAFEAPIQAPAGEETEGGRGLMLVEKLADRWGIDDVREARVWFEVSRAEGGGGP